MKMDIRRFPGRGPKCEINMCRNRAVLSVGDEGFKGGLGRTNICEECAKQLQVCLTAFLNQPAEPETPAEPPEDYNERFEANVSRETEPKPEGGFDLELPATPLELEPTETEPEAEEPEAEEPTEPEQVWPDNYASMKREELIPYAKSRGLKVTVTTKTATIIKGLRELDAIS